MNNKAFTISMALALMAVFMIYSYITSQEEDLKKKYGGEQKVVVAKKDIQEMYEVTENSIEEVAKPKNFIEPGYTKSKAEVVGFIAMVPIRKGEQITLNKIREPGIRTGLSKQVSPGKRAVSIPVDDNSAVNRLLKPGDRVDLMATIEPPGGAKGSQMTKIVGQDIPVLAVGEYVSTTAPRKLEFDDTTGKQVVRNLNIEHNYNTITLEVDPQTALSLALLRDGGSRVSVMLRNNDDTERVNIQAQTLLDVLGPDQSRIIRAPSAQK
ncbi:MAG: Flp pilus assembly protein CpaB [Deltaproteobacteria bacterium]|nr:Flp pilus assembly protein CpaB [Deltaproteobacteria bacterium]